MNQEIIDRFKMYLSQVDEHCLDARIFSDSLAFLGYEDRFVRWIDLVLNDVLANTPTGSRAYPDAIDASENLRSGLESKFKVGIQSLKSALAHALEYHSLTHIRHLDEFRKACSKVGLNAENVLSEFCRQFCLEVDSGKHGGNAVTVQIAMNRGRSGA